MNKYALGRQKTLAELCEKKDNEIDGLEVQLKAVCAELEELQNSLPKIKADAVRDYGKYITETLSNDDLVDVKLIMTPEQYADKLEKGE